jgi:hypothetical protein
MNRIRPIAGALLATLMLSPMFAPVLTPAIAAEVELLPPGGGLTPPKEEPGPAGGTELAPETGTELAPPDAGSGGSNNSGGDSSSEPDTQPTLQTRHFGLNVELSCAVSGTPNAIVVVNHSAEDLPPGTRIKWQLKSEGKRGFFALLSPLAGGDMLVADNVIDGGANEAADCVARVI